MSTLIRVYSILLLILWLHFFRKLYLAGLVIYVLYALAAISLRGFHAQYLVEIIISVLILLLAQWTYVLWFPSAQRAYGDLESG